MSKIAKLLEEFERLNETSDELANSFLTADDKEYIISHCHVNKDELEQVEQAVDKTVYWVWNDVKKKYISREECIKMVGREAYLCAISDSAFHKLSTCDTLDGKTSFVHFDSTKLFK